MTKNEEILRELQDIKAAMNLMNENFESMKQDYDQIKKQNTEILKQNQSLKNKVLDLENQINNIDNYGRRQNLEIQGIPFSPEENTKEIAYNALKKIKEDIKMDDLDLVHRLGREKNKEGKINETRAIIVRFKARQIRNAVFENRRKLYELTCENLGYDNKNHFFINENLSPPTKTLFYEANKLKKELNWKYIWTKNGSIYLRKEDNTQIYNIKSKEDLNLIQ